MSRSPPGIKFDISVLWLSNGIPYLLCTRFQARKQKLSGFVFCLDPDKIRVIEVFTDADVEQSILTISQAAQVTRNPRSSHMVSRVQSFEDLAVVRALGIYLAACIAGGVKANLKIALDLFDVVPQEAAALQKDVHQLIGANNQVSNEFKATRRNPWIAEGIAHLCARLSHDHTHLGPLGRIEVVTNVHDDVTDHGLDQLAIYEDGGFLGISIGESKASNGNISANVTDAADNFASVQNGDHDAHIRRTVNHLRDSLPAALQTLITKSFWRDRRSFLAFAVYNNADTFQPQRARQSLQKLPGAPHSVNLICITLDHYDVFFDGIATAIRESIV